MDVGDEDNLGSIGAAEIAALILVNVANLHNFRLFSESSCGKMLPQTVFKIGVEWVRIA